MDGLPQTNPYLASTEEARVSESLCDLEPGESLPFAGTVRPEAFRSALLRRFSWAGLATLWVGGMICWAGSPASFFNPWRRVGRMRVDLIDELLAVTCVGFFLLAVWHALDGLTALGGRRRERFFLQRAPGLYTTSYSGKLFDDYAYVREAECESWISYAALVEFQSNDRVALLEWGSGAGGLTVLTPEFFSSAAVFERACRLLEKKQCPAFDAQRMRELSDVLRPEELAIQPAQGEVLARSVQVITHRDAWWATLRNLPASVLGSSRPLHLFFGVLGVTALLLAEHLPAVPLVIGGIWLSILALGAVLAIASVRHFFWAGMERLLVSQTEWTEEEVHIATTVGYFRAPWGAFDVRECTSTRIVLSQRDHAAETSQWQPEDFESPEQWERLRQFLIQQEGDGKQGD